MSAMSPSQLPVTGSVLHCTSMPWQRLQHICSYMGTILHTKLFVSSAQRLYAVS